MAAHAGRDITFKIGDAATAMTEEACDALDDYAYQIASAAKRAIDPETEVVVYVDGVEYDRMVDGVYTYAVDYAHGIITFVAGQTDPVTVSGKYLPLVTAAHGRSLKNSGVQPVFAEATEFGDTAPRQTVICHTCEMTLETLAVALEYESGVSSSVEYLFTNARPMFVEVDMAPGVSGNKLRGWFRCQISKSHDLEGVAVTTVEMRGVVQSPAGRPSTDQAMFSVR